MKREDLHSGQVLFDVFVGQFSNNLTRLLNNNDFKTACVNVVIPQGSRKEIGFQNVEKRLSQAMCDKMSTWL